MCIRDSIEKIKKLRILSGAGFKDCSTALNESKDDIDKAIEILRIKGISKASKKMSRSANEGVIAITGDNMTTSILEINCETDFVAKNDDFVIFAKELSDINNIVKDPIDNYLLQEEVPNMYLHNGCKTTMRNYVILCEYGVYLYKEGYVYLYTKKYNRNS